MTLFTIDPEKCNRDGICAVSCPFALIDMTSESGLPTPIAIAEERCMNCGHCVSVCPTGALTLKTMGPSDCRPIKKGAGIRPEQLEQLYLSRRSIRVYKDKPVPRENLQNLFRLVGHAPSGHNSRVVQWLVIEDAAEIKRLSGLVIEWMRGVLEQNPAFGKSMEADILVAAWDRGEDYILHAAPHVVIAHGPLHLKDVYPVRSEFALAMSYLEIAAAAMGIGACWAGFFQAAVQFYPPMNEAVGLPQGQLSYECMMMGYPKYQYQRGPIRNLPNILWR
jgi:nitroreductase/NAD-dependent dihydropyrimidine dehydrogenase PreA subunit